MTPRNRSLFLDRGQAYVYLAYGSSFMLNVSSEMPGVGAGVLIRAIEPTSGMGMMRQNRGTEKVPRSGPTSWTSPPISFAQQFAAKPAVSVAIAGIESAANLDTDRFEFSVEATETKLASRSLFAGLRGSYTVLR